MRLESDQHRPRQSISLLRTTSFEKMLNAVVKESQFRLVFIVPDVAVAYCSSPPPPLSPVGVGLGAVPFGRTSDDFWEIGVGHLRPLIMCLLRTEDIVS